MHFYNTVRFGSQDVKRIELIPTGLTGTDWKKREGFYSQQQSSYTVHISLDVTSLWVQSAGCERETPRHSTRQPLLTFKSWCSLFYCLTFFFCTKSKLFFKFWELDQQFLLFEAKFSHVLMSAWSLIDCCCMICVPCLIFTDDQVTGFVFFFSLMLIICHAWNQFWCCADWWKLNCVQRFLIWRNSLCAN